MGHAMMCMSASCMPGPSTHHKMHAACTGLGISIHLTNDSADSASAGSCFGFGCVMADGSLLQLRTKIARVSWSVHFACCMASRQDSRPPCLINGSMVALRIALAVAQQPGQDI